MEEDALCCGFLSVVCLPLPSNCSYFFQAPILASTTLWTLELSSIQLPDMCLLMAESLAQRQTEQSKKVRIVLCEIVDMYVARQATGEISDLG